MRKFFSKAWNAITFPFRWLGNLIARPFRAVQRFMMTEPVSHSIGEIFDTLTQSEEARKQVAEDLNKLRWHILRSLGALAIASIAAWIYVRPITEFLAIPVGGTQALQVLDLTESIGVYMKIAVMAGFGVAIIYIAFELWLYFAPGLKVQARWLSFGAIPLTFLFFWFGAWFTNRFILPTAIDFLIGFGDFQTNPTADKYYSLITRLLFWISISFEFPMVAILLTRLGWITYRDLLAQWRLAIILIGVISAVITPTTDMGSMAIVMAPMTVLFFIGILFSFLFRRKEEKTANA